MPDKRPPDFTNDEARLIEATLTKRDGHDIEVQPENHSISFFN